MFKSATNIRAVAITAFLGMMGASIIPVPAVEILSPIRAVCFLTSIESFIA